MPRYTGNYPTRSAYESALADKWRDRIFDVIGRQCEQCGEDIGLEVNHVYRRSWVVRKLSKYRRAKRYWQELQAGVPLTPLCAACNKVYKPLPAPAPAQQAPATTMQPF